MSKQYVQIEFSPGGQAYTYLNDEEDEVQIGDFVKVETKYGISAREVVGLTEKPPQGITLKNCYLFREEDNEE